MSLLSILSPANGSDNVTTLETIQGLLACYHQHCADENPPDDIVQAKIPVAEDYEEELESIPTGGKKWGQFLPFVPFLIRDDFRKVKCHLLNFDGEEKDHDMCSTLWDLTPLPRSSRYLENDSPNEIHESITPEMSTVGPEDDASTVKSGKENQPNTVRSPSAALEIIVGDMSLVINSLFMLTSTAAKVTGIPGDAPFWAEYHESLKRMKSIEEALKSLRSNQRASSAE